MSSHARQEFLETYRALVSACDEDAVKGQDSKGRVLRKGLTVAAFNMLEGFIGTRWGELMDHANRGHTQFQDLPETMQNKILERTFSVAAGEVRRGSLELAEMKTYSSRVGESLVTTSGGLSLSGLVGKWDGSNIGSADIATSLKLFQVDSPWNSIKDLTEQFGFSSGGPSDSKYDLSEAFRELTRTRNQAAHEMAFNITTIQLRTVPQQILRVAFGYDVLASIAVNKIFIGDPDFLNENEKVKVSQLKYYSVVLDRGSDFALYSFPSQSRRARKVDADGEKLFAYACNNSSNGRFVVRQNREGQVVDWMIAGPG